MEVANRFWKESFGREAVVDWDDFINSFSLFTEKYSKILLNQTQKAYLKHLIDPHEKQELDIGQFTTFVDQYWMVPSNRTNLFKHKFKPPTGKPSEDWQGLSIKVRDEEQGEKQYVMKSTLLKCGATSTQLRTKQFVRVGSAEGNDIRLDNIYINQRHLKLVKIGDDFLVRDVSKSNRSKLKIDRTLLLKAGMVVNAGDFDLIVDAARGGSGPQEKLSVYIDLNMKSVDPKEIYRKYGLDSQMEEPESATEVASSENIDDQEEVKIVNRGPLELITVNRRTQQYKSYTLEDTTTIGKSPLCNIYLPDIKVPLKACTISYSLDTWMLKPQENAELFVHLANREQLSQHRPSNLQILQKDYTIVCGSTSLSFDYLLRPEEI